MDAYSNDPAPLGKKVHDATDPVPATDFDTRPELAELKGKAPNATTGVVDVPGGKAIYQLVSVRDDLPQDFEKNKTKLRQDRIQQVGRTQVTTRIKGILAGGNVKWQSPGYQALSAVADASAMGYVLDQAAAKKAFDKAGEAIKSQDGSDRRLATMALLALTDPATNVGAKTAETLTERRSALDAAQTAGIEDTALSLELAGLYGDAKDGAKATANLIAASKSNHQYDASGERTFRDIAGKALEFQKKGILTKDQLASVQAQQSLWTAARTDNSKAATQAKTDETSQKAANDAEIARQKAEAEKAPPASTPKSDANAKEIARQKAEAAKGAAPQPTASAKGVSLLPPSTAGSGALSDEGRLTLVASPIGNLGDLSPRAAETLSGAGVWFVEDTRVSGKLAAHLGIKKPMRVLNDHTSPAQVERYADEIKGGLDAVVLTDGGAPVVSDPGALLGDACHERGVPVFSVPGPSAVTNALALSGFFGQRFAFLGFLGRKAGAIRGELEPFADSPLTLVLFESPHRIDAMLAAAHEALGPRRYAICREMTKAYEQTVRARLPEVPDGESVPRKGEFTVVIEGRRRRQNTE